MTRIKGLCTLPDFLVTDPCYGPNCKYRYHKPSKLNVGFEFCVKEVYLAEYGITALNLDLSLWRLDESIQKPFLLLNSSGTCCHMPWLRKNAYEIGVDSASLFIGPSSNFDDDNVILTGSDGGVGNVFEFFIKPGTAYKPKDGPPVFHKSGFYGIQVTLSFSPSVVSEDFLVQYLLSNLNAKDYQEV